MFDARTWKAAAVVWGCVMALVLSHPVGAMFVDLSEPVPVDRLIRTLQEHVRENPNDAEGLYTLARVHSLVYAKTVFSADARGREPAEHVTVIPADKRSARDQEDQEDDDGPELPGFGPYTTVQVGRGQGEPQRRSDLARDHLLESLEHYERAVEADPEKALYRLGYGWMLEQASYYFDDEDKDDSSSATTRATRPTTDNSTTDSTADPATITERGTPVSRPEAYRGRAIEQYRKVLDLKLEEELDEESYLDTGPDTLVSREAAEGVLRLLDADDVQPEERGEVERMKEALKKFEAKPVAVTPILFSLDPHCSFDELFDAGVTTRFDLMGDGLDREWPWVRPTTALLVWDPEETGTITSGRQLFGSVTWWIFWETGYDALSMLDDDRDGYLRGEELTGVAAWFDRNSNGVTDPGEVTPLTRLGVAALRTGAVAADRSDLAAWNAHGLEMTDGRTLPTWDWRPRAVER